MDHSSFIAQLPEECQSISIEPRHKVALRHYFVGRYEVRVILLTDMPGDCDKQWILTRSEYYAIQPKHEVRDRWIRENMEPDLAGPQNPPKRRLPIQLLLF